MKRRRVRDMDDIATAAQPATVASIAEAARRQDWAAVRVMAGTSGRALGHATSGPALQQNLVCVMEGRN